MCVHSHAAVFCSTDLGAGRSIESGCSPNWGNFYDWCNFHLFYRDELLFIFAGGDKKWSAMQWQIKFRDRVSTCS